MIEDAIQIASLAHKGQKDKVGKPYILHPLRVMLQMDSEEEMATAVLHDTIEDTTVTMETLVNAGFTADVQVAVLLLTHLDEVPYLEYIAKIAENPIARKVKLADLRDNMDLSRLPRITAHDEERMLKYQDALTILTR